jgi:predicted lactoylglutathione lyase
MNLGSFSVSLAVKDIAASQNFYSKLGFDVIGGKDYSSPASLAHAS